MHEGCQCSQANDCRTFRVFPQVVEYKTNKKMAQLTARPGILLAQYQYVGTTYIGYSYIDEYG